MEASRRSATIPTILNIQRTWQRVQCVNISASRQLVAIYWSCRDAVWGSLPSAQNDAVRLWLRMLTCELFYYRLNNHNNVDVLLLTR